MYANEKIITASSINLYYINHDGRFTTRTINGSTTKAEQYVAKYRQLNLTLYPMLACEMAIGACDGFDVRFLKAHEHKEEFIIETIRSANKNGWHGYSVALSVNISFNISKLTGFMVDWANALYKTNRSLKIYVEGDIEPQWWNSMNTHYADNVAVIGYFLTSDYDDFLRTMSWYFKSIDIKKRVVIELDYFQGGTNDALFIKAVNWCITNHVNTLAFYLVTWYLIPSSSYESIRNFIYHK